MPGSTDRRRRSGFIALGRVEDYAAGVVFRHEQTLSGPKADRLELLRHTHTNTGQLFMLYTDTDRRVDLLLDGLMRCSAPAEARDEYDVVHRLWPVFDRDAIASIVGAMAGRKLVIADGHHRYETALAYRDECRAQSGKRDPGAPYEKTMMTFFNTRSEGLLILPTHRVLSNLAEFNLGAFRAGMMQAFEQESYSFTSDAARAVASYRFQRDLAAGGRDGQAIGMYTPGEFTLFRLRSDAPLATLMPDVPPSQRHLDVVLLHRLLLGAAWGSLPLTLRPSEISRTNAK